MAVTDTTAPNAEPRNERRREWPEWWPKWARDVAELYFSGTTSAIVRKSRYRRSAAAFAAGAAAFGSNVSTSWFIGIEEMTWLHGYSVRVPSFA